MPLSIAAAARKDATTRATMTHQHFATVAAIIAVIPWMAGSLYQRKLVAEHFADHLAATNPRFDRARFLAACKVTP